MSLLKATGDNYGGLRQVLIARRSAVKSTLQTMAGAVTVSIAQAYIDANFEEIEFNREVGLHDEVPALGAHGKNWTQSIELQLLKDREALRTFFKSYENQQVVVLLTDNNGVMKLVGNEAEGLYLNDERHTGLRVMDLNQCNCHIAGGTTFESRIVTVI